jgi:hypothetical protein
MSIAAKFYLVWDSMRRGSRDGALVRVSVPLVPGIDVGEATKTILQFVLAGIRRHDRIVRDIKVDVCTRCDHYLIFQARD